MTQAGASKHGRDANSVIPRSSLFYSDSFVPKVGLPSTHILNQRPAKCRLLLVTLLDGGSRSGRKQWRRTRELGLPLCLQIFHQHSSCDYHRLLNRYCPLPDFCCRGSGEEERSSPVSLPQVSSAYSPSDGVVSFLRTVLRHVFPPEFWGSERNFGKVLNVVDIFVKLRRQEQLPMKAIMNGICVKDVVWVYGGSEVKSRRKGKLKRGTWSKSLHEAATARIGNVMKWLFVHFIIPLLSSVFYVTETEFSARRVLYYRKPVWSIFRSLSMKKLLVRQYTEISISEAAHVANRQEMGFSKLRLLPKKTGVRALALLSKREFPVLETDGADSEASGTSEESDSCMETDLVPPSAKKSKLSAHKHVRSRSLGPKAPSTNAVLKNIFDVLRYERERHPELFGSGVFGLNEVYPEYVRFMEALRALKVSSCGSLPKLYFASVDIEQCYDGIVQDHLLAILPKLLTEKEYLIQKSAVIHPFQSMGRVIWKPVKQTGAPEAYCAFGDAVESLTSNYSRSVFFDNGGSSLVHRDNAMSLLQEHLLSHAVVVRGRYGDRFLLQKSGIPQGSILSTLLCNYYYGDVEHTLLGSILDYKSENAPCMMRKHDGHVTLLVRIVDDFLMITTNRDLSNKFLKVMNAGSEELGVCTNKDKTLVNYRVQLEGNDEVRNHLPSRNVETGDRKQSRFQWCGMLFDTDTGETSVDYSRFAGGKARDALTVDRCDSEGRQLEIRMKSFVRPRCQPILFDPRINSARVVCTNFCQALLLCAMKTCSYVDDMERGVQRNAEFIVRSVDDVILYCHKLIAKRLRNEAMAVALAAQRQSPLLPLKTRDAMWLGRKAFLSIFCRVKGCNDVVTLLAPKCASTRYHHLLQDILDEAIRQFGAEVSCM